MDKIIQAKEIQTHSNMKIYLTAGALSAATLLTLGALYFRSIAPSSDEQNSRDGYKIQANVNTPSKKSLDEIARDDIYSIRDLINDARGKPASEYKGAYKMFDDAINSSRAGYSNLDMGHPRAKSYRGLEINAYMWQAYFLTEAGQLLPTEHEILVNGIGAIKRNTNNNQGVYEFNLFKALSNYDRVEKLLQEAEDAKISFGNSAIVEGMDGWGKVVKSSHLYTRMLQTIDTLLKAFDNIDKTKLIQKRQEIYRKKERLPEV